MKFLWSIFAGLGGLFLAIGLVFLAVDLRFFAGARRTEGEVVSVRYNGKGSGAPDVAYTDDIGRARVYRSSMYSSPSYAVGDRVTIAFHSSAPDDAAIDAFWDRFLLPTIFAGIGSVHFSIGLFGLVRRARRKREIAWLLREGQRVDAEVTAVDVDTSIRVNRRHPYIVRVQAKLPGDAAPRTFTSRRFWYDPRPHLGRTIPVCYDPHDPARHVVDTGDLAPRRAGASRQS